MQLDAKMLADLVVKEVQAQEAKDPTIAKSLSPPDFCTIWPKAKPVLEFISGVAIVIPGVGAKAGAVLAGLIKIADELANSLCKR